MKTYDALGVGTLRFVYDFCNGGALTTRFSDFWNLRYGLPLNLSVTFLRYRSGWF